MQSIYLLVNTVNDMAYIGKTARYKTRMNEHRKHTGKCPKLHAAIEKYGWDNFQKTELCQVEDCLASVVERAYIKYFKTLSPNGYNLTDGGDGGRPTEEACKRISMAKKGIKFTEEHKAKLSIARKARGGWTEETRERFMKTTSQTKHKPTAETIERIRQSNTGRKRSPECCAKMSMAKQGHIPWNKGKTMSEEYRQKCRDRQLGKPSNRKGTKFSKTTNKFE